jgi:hypothetical protein
VNITLKQIETNEYCPNRQRLSGHTTEAPAVVTQRNWRTAPLIVGQVWTQEAWRLFHTRRA